jgi:hypothetical protein
MKRYIVIKEFLKCLKDNDVAIFSENEMSKEAFQYDREGNFYIMDSPGSALSVALGIAMNTNKRVFVFINDECFLREMGAIAQAAVSRCINVFYVILDSGLYQSSGFQPTIFEGFAGIKNILFGLGLIVHDFSHYFENKALAEMNQLVETVKGPMAILLKVDKGLKRKLKSLNHRIDFKERLMGFVANEEIGTSLFTTPNVVIDRDSVQGGNR